MEHGTVISRSCMETGARRHGQRHEATATAAQGRLEPGREDAHDADVYRHCRGRESRTSQEHASAQGDGGGTGRLLVAGAHAGSKWPRTPESVFVLADVVVDSDANGVSPRAPVHTAADRLAAAPGSHHRGDDPVGSSPVAAGAGRLWIGLLRHRHEGVSSQLKSRLGLSCTSQASSCTRCTAEPEL